MATRRINFTSIPVDDQDRAKAFYTEHLGFDVQIDAPFQDDWRWIFLNLPGAETRLHFATRKELTWQEGMPVLALAVDDVDADAKRFADAGVKVTSGPDDAPWAPGARYLMIRDSEDNVVFLESGKGA